MHGFVSELRRRALTPALWPTSTGVNVRLVSQPEVSCGTMRTFRVRRRRTSAALLTWIAGLNARPMDAGAHSSAPLFGLAPPPGDLPSDAVPSRSQLDERRVHHHLLRRNVHDAERVEQLGGNGELGDLARALPSQDRTAVGVHVRTRGANASIQGGVC